MKDYNELVDDIVENFLSIETNSIEVLPYKPNAASFVHLDSLLDLAIHSFDEVKGNVDTMPSGMRTILDEVEQTMTKYSYLFKKFA